MAIYVDADACPVKEEIYRVARRHQIQVYVVANSPMRVPAEALIELIVVRGGFDAADDWIAERVGTGDVAVTADIPLADRCLTKRARVLGPKGHAFTEDSIGEALAARVRFEARGVRSCPISDRTIPRANHTWVTAKEKSERAAPPGRPSSSSCGREPLTESRTGDARQYAERADRDQREWFRDDLAHMVRHAQDGLRKLAVAVGQTGGSGGSHDVRLALVKRSRSQSRLPPA